jgi:hypothetical protein
MDSKITNANWTVKLQRRIGHESYKGKFDSNVIKANPTVKLQSLIGQ